MRLRLLLAATAIFLVLGGNLRGQDPAAILRDVLAQYPGDTQHVLFLREAAKALNAAGVDSGGRGPFGLLVKTTGANCEGFSCDVLCAGQKDQQGQWDVRTDSGVIWPGVLTPEMGARVDVCVIPDGAPGPEPEPPSEGPDLQPIYDHLSKLEAWTQQMWTAHEDLRLRYQQVAGALAEQDRAHRDVLELLLARPVVTHCRASLFGIPISCEVLP